MVFRDKCGYTGCSAQCTLSMCVCGSHHVLLVQCLVAATASGAQTASARYATNSQDEEITTTNSLQIERNTKHADIVRPLPKLYLECAPSARSRGLTGEWSARARYNIERDDVRSIYGHSLAQLSLTFVARGFTATAVQ